MKEQKSNSPLTIAKDDDLIPGETGEPTSRLTDEAFELYRLALVSLGVTEDDASKCASTCNAIYTPEDPTREEVLDNTIVGVRSYSEARITLVDTLTGIKDIGEDRVRSLKHSANVNLSRPIDKIKEIIGQQLDKNVEKAVSGALSAVVVPYRANELQEANVNPNNAVVVHKRPSY